MTTAEKQYSPSREDFEKLFNEVHADDETFIGRVVEGKVVEVGSDFALVDVGLKSEGRIPLREFGTKGADTEVQIGDTIDVYVERIENAQGEAVLSRDRARREEAWELLEKSYKKEAEVEGIIFGRVKGGFTVDLSGAVAFLPGSQLDVRPLRDVNALMNVPLTFQILKMDRKRGNIVVSRRALLEEERAEQRSELMENMEEGQTINGVVKNITEYGAFVDLGGVDGLLHLTDMSWSRLGHPTEIMKVGDNIDVKIIRINPESQRISLGIKQLGDDPWDGIADKYPLGKKVSGKVTNITDYGAFIELEDGIEGLVHVSEMSWTKKNVHPGKILSTSQEVEVKVLEIDPEKRRISLGLKQVQDNPWEHFGQAHKIGSEIEGTVKNITEFGLFIGLDEDIDGMVHLSDLDWNRSGDDAIKEYKKGDTVKAVILDINPDKERVSLGIKQVGGDPFAIFADKKKGDVVTGIVSQVNDNGVELAIGDSGIKGFIRKAELSRDRNDQRPDRFAKDEKVDAVITNIDKSSRKIALSIKALEIKEEKQAVAQYGSSDSGASLGDILGAALKESKEVPAKKEAKKETKAAKAPAKKAAAKKAPAKKAPVKKAEAKKAAPKKAPAKKAAPKKAAAKTAKPAAAKKAPAKKAEPKKAAAKKDSKK